MTVVTVALTTDTKRNRESCKDDTRGHEALRNSVALHSYLGIHENRCNSQRERIETAQPGRATSVRRVVG